MRHCAWQSDAATKSLCPQHKPCKAFPSLSSTVTLRGHSSGCSSTRLLQGTDPLWAWVMSTPMPKLGLATPMASLAKQHGYCIIPCLSPLPWLLETMCFSYRLFQLLRPLIKPCIFSLLPPVLRSFSEMQQGHVPSPCERFLELLSLSLTPHRDSADKPLSVLCCSEGFCWGEKTKKFWQQALALKASRRLLSLCHEGCPCAGWLAWLSAGRGPGREQQADCRLISSSPLNPCSKLATKMWRSRSPGRAPLQDTTGLLPPQAVGAVPGGCRLHSGCHSPTRCLQHGTAAVPRLWQQFPNWVLTAETWSRKQLPCANALYHMWIHDQTLLFDRLKIACSSKA